MAKSLPELTPVAPLYEALTRKLIPWAEQWETLRIIVAQPEFKLVAGTELPRGVEITKRKLRATRPTTRMVRYYNYTIPTEHLPSEGVEITSLPVITSVLMGPARLEAGNYFIDSEPGNFIVFPPGVPRTDGMHPHLKSWRSGEGSADLFWMYYWKEGIICHICHSRGATHQSSATHGECYVRSPQALLCFEAMSVEMSKQKAGDPRIYKGLLLSLLIILRRELEAGNYIQPGAAVSETSLSADPDPILRAAHYIRFHLNEKLTIEDMARRHFMSRSQFTRQFRKTLGMSFLDFLTEQRLAKVEALLFETDWSLETICSLSGLQISNLRTLLRHHRGMSPLEFRRAARKGDITLKSDGGGSID